MKIAFIGLGSMGAPLARLIARAGHELGVYDSHAPAGEAFRDIAAVAGSPADAARGAEVVCVCVRDDRQVEDVVSGGNGLAGTLAPGALLLVHSTIRIDTVQRIGAALAAQGVALVDAPVSRTRRSDDAPFVFTMLGGESRDVERARAVVESFSTDVEHMGPSGAGMATKIANNLVTWTHIVVAAQANALAASQGVPYERFKRLLTANGNLTPTVAALMDGMHAATAAANPQRAAFLASQAGIGEKDLELAIECSRALGLDVAMIERTRDRVRPAMTGQLPKT